METRHVSTISWIGPIPREHLEHKTLRVEIQMRRTGFGMSKRSRANSPRLTQSSTTHPSSSAVCLNEASDHDLRSLIQHPHVGLGVSHGPRWTENFGRRSCNSMEVAGEKHPLRCFPAVVSKNASDCMTRRRRSLF